MGPSRCPNYRTLFGASGDPYRGCLEGPPWYGALKHPKVRQSTTHKVLGSTPIVSLEQPVLSCRCLIYVYYYMTLGGPSGHLFPVVGSSWDLIHWFKGPSRLDGALRDLA